MKQPQSHRLKMVREKFKARVWPVVHRLAWPVVWLRRHLRPHKIHLTRVEGVVVGGNETLAILCGATAQNKEYFLQLALQKVDQETDLGTVRLMDAFKPEYSRGKNAGLAVLETNQAMHQWLGDDGWFFIPAWLVGEIQVPLPEKALRSDTVRTIHRKIRKYGFEYEVTCEEARFKEYYDNMHVPYVTKEYGPTACLQSYAEMRTRCEAAGYALVLLRKKSQPDVIVAGGLVIYEPEKPRLWSFGVRDGNVELVREGVLAALYFFCFEHLAKQGFKLANMGGSRPFLRDGVLTFKKRISQSIVLGRWEGFAVRILELTPATKAFLLNNPFFFVSRGRVHGAVFTEAPLTAKMVEELEHAFFYAGMNKLLLYFFQWDKNFRTADLPPELAARVEVRDAAEVVSGRLHLP